MVPWLSFTSFLTPPYLAREMVSVTVCTSPPWMNLTPRPPLGPASVIFAAILMPFAFPSPATPECTVTSNVGR